MKIKDRIIRNIRLSLFTVVLTATTICHPATAQEATSLFNGKDLTGWVQMHGGDWSVENGIIVGRNGVDWTTNPEKSGSWLRTEKEYDDFVFEFEYSVNEKGNSGVFLRSALEKNPAFTGHEMQILDDRGRDPKVWTTGALYDFVAPTKNMSKPANEWNQAKIETTGSHIVIWLNGEKIVDSKSDRRTKGYLGLQNHDDKAVIKFRNLKITEKPAAKAPASSPLVYEGNDGIGKGKHIVFIANDHEYRSEETCPLMAKILAKHHGFRCTVLFGIDDDGHIKAGDAHVPGMEALRDADLLVFFTRFMNLPDEQVDMLVEYFERGGPVVGIRTSTHCFNNLEGKWAKLNFNYVGKDYLGGLGEQIFGNTWHKGRGQSHYGNNHELGARITPIASAADNPILAGVRRIHTYSGGYKSQPPAGSTSLLELQVLNTYHPSDDINTEKPLVSAGWTRSSYVVPSGERKDARVVYTSFGASEDMQDEDARRFVLNACLWAVGLEAEIESDLNVSIVGPFVPSPYTNGAFSVLNVKPSDLAGMDSRLMPGKTFDGLKNPKASWRVVKALKVRPELKAKLQKTHPGIGEGTDKPPRKKK